MRFSAALRRSERTVWYSECAYRDVTNGSDSRMAAATAGSFSPNGWVAMSAAMSRKRYGWPVASLSTAAREGPTDSDGPKATGNERNMLGEAADSAACHAGRCPAT